MATETKNTKTFYNTEIPVDWEFIPLGEIFKLTSGKTKPIELFDEPIDSNIYPVFGGNGIMGFASEFNSEGEIILIGRVGEYCGITRFVDEKCWITDNALYSKEYLKNVDAKYLAYKLQLEDLSRLRNKGGQPLISQGPISIHKISLPKSLPEQKAIAQVLSTADAAIHTTEKLIAQKELRKKWLMQQLLTGKKRLKGFSGEWKSEILGNVVNLQHGYQFRDEDFVEEGIPVIKIRNVIGYDLVLSDMTFVDANRLEEFKSVVIENGDLLMSLTGNIGRVVEVKGIDKPMFQNYRVGKFTPIDKQITKAFLKFILSSDILFRQFNGLANQSAQANFGKQDMDKLKFRFPISIEEQTAIAQVLQAADKEISLLKAKAEKLREQKKGLMQVLLTGKKRLNQDFQD